MRFKYRFDVDHVNVISLFLILLWNQERNLMTLNSTKIAGLVEFYSIIRFANEKKMIINHIFQNIIRKYYEENGFPGEQ